MRCSCNDGPIRARCRIHEADFSTHLTQNAGSYEPGGTIHYDRLDGRVVGTSPPGYDAALIAQGRREAIAEVVGWLGEQMESLAKSDMSDAREVEDQTLVLGVMNDIRLHLEKFK